jgi:hypothetical protein
MRTSRTGHTATLLPSGKVLVTGGSARDTEYQSTSGPFNSVEIYDPATRSWSSSGPLVFARANHAATLLPSGEVLIFGGVEAGSYEATAEAEIYNPVSGTSMGIMPMLVPRINPASVLLPSGQVLVVGGDNSSYGAELYDPTR